MKNETLFSDYMFSDYIEVVTSTHDYIIYTPAYSRKLGLYLYCDDCKPIRNVFLNGKRLIVHYVDDSEEILDVEVDSVLINGSNFKKKMGFDIEDVLFRYGISEVALSENFDITKAYNHEKNKSIVKKRS